MHISRQQIEAEMALREQLAQSELDNAIVSDPNITVNAEREAVAFETFSGMVGLIMETCEVSRTEAIRRMILSEEIDPTDIAAVQKYFWCQGLSESKINELVTEFLSTQ